MLTEYDTCSYMLYTGYPLPIQLLFFLYFFFSFFFFGCAGSSLRGLSLVVASVGYSSLQYVGFLLWWLLLLRSTGSRCAGFSSCGTQASVVVARGLSSCDTQAQQLWLTVSRAASVVVAHGLSCSTACGIFPDQGSNPRPLHWQADS